MLCMQTVATTETFCAVPSANFLCIIIFHCGPVALMAKFASVHVSLNTLQMAYQI